MTRAPDVGGPLTVHLPCLYVRGSTTYGHQPCGCEPPVSWPGCDVSRSADLCQVCARDTAGGVTRWSWLGCEWCRRVERELRCWLGMPVLPLGRHSIMNGVAAPVDRPVPDGVDAFATAMTGLSSSWDRLRRWGREEARRLSDGLSDGPEDVPLDEWRRRFPGSPAASVDAYERCLDLTLPGPLKRAVLRATAL